MYSINEQTEHANVTIKTGVLGVSKKGEHEGFDVCAKRVGGTVDLYNRCIERTTSVSPFLSSIKKEREKDKCGLLCMHVGEKNAEEKG